MIERAKLIGGLRVTGHVERVRPGQSGQAVMWLSNTVRVSSGNSCET